MKINFLVRYLACSFIEMYLRPPSASEEAKINDWIKVRQSGIRYYLSLGDQRIVDKHFIIRPKAEFEVRLHSTWFFVPMLPSFICNFKLLLFSRCLGLHLLGCISSFAWYDSLLSDYSAIFMLVYFSIRRDWWMPNYFCEKGLTH